MIFNLLTKYFPNDLKADITNQRNYFYKEIDYYLSKTISKKYHFNAEEMKLLIDLSFFVKYVIIPIENVTELYDKFSKRKVNAISVLQSGQHVFDKNNIESMKNMITEIDKLIFLFNINHGKKIGYKNLNFENIDDFLKSCEIVNEK